MLNFDTYIVYNVCSKTLQNKLIKLTLDNISWSNVEQKAKVQMLEKKDYLKGQGQLADPGAQGGQ